MVELCAVVTSHPGGAPRAFSISATTRDGTAGSVHYTHSRPCTNVLSFTTVAGDDYVAVAGEELVFNRGDTRVCHTIDILRDQSIEIDSNEQFFSDLAYVSGVLSITISPPTAQVIIDDCDGQECKFYCQYHGE